MRYYLYETNLKWASCLEGKSVSLIAKNKKEALKFIKDFKGMKLGARIKKQENSYNYEFDVMEKQKELLNEYLNNKKIVIEG